MEDVLFARNSLGVMTNNNEQENKLRRLENRPPWLCGPSPLSRQGCRFQLPMDTKVLEQLTVVNYLTMYCVLSARRKHLFKTIFIKADRDHDGVINSFEIRKAILDLYCESIKRDYLEHILELVDCRPDSVFNIEQFAAIAAFSERYLCTRFHTKEEVNSNRELLEETDFGGLKAKLEGFRVPACLTQVLMLL